MKAAWLILTAAVVLLVCLTAHWLSLIPPAPTGVSDSVAAPPGEARDVTTREASTHVTWQLP